MDLFSEVDTFFGFSMAALLFAVAATVLAFIFIVPEKRRKKLNAFGKFLHDTCNFKYLVVEKILQAMYIFSTVFFVLTGFFMLFQTVYGKWLGGAGLLMMILAPIVLRLVYELMMMTVLLVKNVIGINKKLKNQNGDDGMKDVFAAPDMSEMREAIRQRRETQAQEQAQNVAPVAPAPVQPRFCTVCGTPLDASGNCPNCTK